MNDAEIYLHKVNSWLSIGQSSVSNFSWRMLGITIGDPAGIGPEIVLKGVSSLSYEKLLLIGSSSIIQREQKNLGIENIPVIADIESDADIRPGRPSKEAGELAYRTILEAIRLIKEGRISSLVTAPVCKEAINMAGYEFVGHTDMLASSFNVRRYTMFFHSSKFNLALVTRHIPLSAVSSELTKERIYDTIEQVNDFLKKHRRILGIRKVPKIGVLGLNPHAGEGGRIGTEEERFIIPAIEAAREKGINTSGPLVPDTAYRGDFDLYVAMYHDQGLIPLKTLSFESAVNITIGLPFIRTSPPHGTAFDIAGKGIADSGPMMRAIEMSMNLATDIGK